MVSCGDDRPYLRVRFWRYLDSIKNLGETRQTSWTDVTSTQQQIFFWDNRKQLAKSEPSPHVALKLPEMPLFMWDDTSRRDYWACAIVKRRQISLGGGQQGKYITAPYLGIVMRSSGWSRWFVRAPCCLPSLHSSHMRSKMWTTHGSLIEPNSGLTNLLCFHPVLVWSPYLREKLFCVLLDKSMSCCFCPRRISSQITTFASWKVFPTNSSEFHRKNLFLLYYVQPQNAKFCHGERRRWSSIFQSSVSKIPGY